MFARLYGSTVRLMTGEGCRYLPNIILDHEAKQRAMQDTAWADGLRGIAAVYVVCSHVVLCYALGLVNPCCATDSDRPSLFQRPIFRLVASGHSWVAVFFILLGFVNSLKPLSLARSGQPDVASSKLAASAFSRIFRLMLPATFATILSWTICQFGLYELARNSDAFWLRENSPEASSNIFAAFVDLKDALVNTWKLGANNAYDQPQWALIYLLEGSLMTILGLLMTINMTSVWRLIALSLIVIVSSDWGHHLGDPQTGMACFGGVILAELSLSSFPSKMAPISPFVSPPLTIFALILMSYPGGSADASPWSAALHRFGESWFGGGAVDRTYGTLGGLTLVASIIISPHARAVLSGQVFKWLGKISFAIYLLHGTVLRTVFAWIMFAGSELQEVQDMVDQGPYWPNEVWVTFQRYPLPGYFRCLVATLVLGVVTLGCSHLWNLKVEPVCAKITSMSEKLVRGQCSSQDVLEAVKITTEKESLLPVRRE